MITINSVLAFLLGGAAFVGFFAWLDSNDRRRLRELTNEYRDETARLAKLRKADRTPIGGGK